MIYCISDIHGEYDLFIQLLKKINFSPNDKMIICGDMIDKGKNSIKLLKFIKSNSNMVPILGDHECEFLKFYQLLMSDLEDNHSSDEVEQVLDMLQKYFPNDEEMLDWDILDWLETLPHYVEEENYICVHAGLPVEASSGGELLSKVPNEFFIYDKSFKTNGGYTANSKCVFFGHTPTSLISNDCKIIAYKKEETMGDSISNYYKVHLDTGTWLYGVMGCFCIDNCKDYYVSETMSL